MDFGFEGSAGSGAVLELELEEANIMDVGLEWRRKKFEGLGFREDLS